ncbi:MAG: peptidyl-prolyl cis-trans isomerase [Acidobacteria bacterium]|nr:peptidyl-prolyl cis-trans isomerase [Acidobacteriota bacterium]
MLKTVRKHSRSFLMKLILWGVVASFILTIFLVWGKGRAGISGNPNVVAKVGDTLINNQTFIRLYRNQLSRIRGSLSGEQGKLIKRIVASQILNGLVNQELLVAEAKRLGLFVTQEELTDRILNDYGFKVNGRFIGEKQYAEILRHYGYTVAEFEEAVKKEILVNKLQNLLLDGVVVTPEEVRREFMRRNERVKFSYILVSPEEFLSQVKVSDKQLALYFEENKERYRIPERRKLSFLTLTLASLSYQPKVNDDEIERYYERNIENFRTPERRRASQILFRLPKGASPTEEEKVKKRAEEVLAKLRAGGDFAELAKRYSEDEGTKNLGGDLGLVEKGRLLPELDQALFTMRLGEVSDLIKTKAGYHILKLNEIKRPSHKSVDDPAVRSAIREAIRAEKRRARLANLAKEICTVAKEKKGDLAKAVKSLNLTGVKVETTDLFSKDRSIEQMGIAFPAAEVAFSLKKGALSEPIPLRNGYAIVKVLDIKPSYIPRLSEVRERVEKDFRFSLARRLAETEARKLAKQAKRFGDLTPLGKEVKEVGPATRDQGFGELGDAPILIKNTFSLNVGEIGGPIPVDKGYVVIKIEEKEKPSSEEFLAVREQLARELTNRRQLALLTSLVNRLREETKISINSDLLEKIIGG